MNAYQAGQELLCGGYSSYTPTGMGFFKKENRLYDTPELGDIVYFYTKRLGRVSHVGLVASAEFNDGLWTIFTIEGNTNAGATFERDGGEVALKKHTFAPDKVGGENLIFGFGRPKYGYAFGTCDAETMIQIAKQEIGYVEKASSKSMGLKTANPGAANYTKYGEWYGMNPAQWCQIFICWCAYKACEYASNRPSGWIMQDNGLWTYRKTDGSFAQNEWEYINGRWYVFDGKGYMIKGWFQQADGWYYLGEDGGMLSGQWLAYKGKDYYLTDSGVMATDAYIRSEKAYAPMQYIYYFVGADGAWVPEKDTEKPDLEAYDLVA